MIVSGIVIPMGMGRVMEENWNPEASARDRRSAKKW